MVGEELGIPITRDLPRGRLAALSRALRSSEKSPASRRGGHPSAIFGRSVVVISTAWLEHHHFVAWKSPMNWWIMMRWSVNEKNKRGIFDGKITSKWIGTGEFSAWISKTFLSIQKFREWPQLAWCFCRETDQQRITLWGNEPIPGQSPIYPHCLRETEQIMELLCTSNWVSQEVHFCSHIIFKPSWSARSQALQRVNAEACAITQCAKPKKTSAVCLVIPASCQTS